MPLSDSVHEQATQILLNHAEISRIMCKIYNSIPASHPVSSTISFEFVYMKMKVEFWCVSRPSHTFVFCRIATFSIFSCQKKCFLLKIKHSQAHRNSTLQYKIQQSVFRAKNGKVPPYIIKFAPGPADPISGLLPKLKTNSVTTRNLGMFPKQMYLDTILVFQSNVCPRLSSDTKRKQVPHRAGQFEHTS